MNRIPVILIIAFMTSVVSSTFSQTTSPSFVTVEGAVLKPLKLTLKDIEKYPAREVTAKDRDGNAHTYKGTLLSVVLDSAGVTLGKQLRGENLVKYVLVTAADNYQVVYSLPEIDPEFTSNTILLATQVDGKPLPKGEGPFRLVNPADKKLARWIREISSIKVVFSKQ